MAKGKYEKWRTSDGLMLLEAWARDGLSDAQIAMKCGVSRSRLSEWKVRFEDIRDALSRGKEPVDVEVENALYKLALGYTVKLCKHYKLKRVYYDERNRRCETEELVEAYDEEHVPANVNAQKFWLANRKTDVWRERHEAEVSAQALENAKDILGGVDSAIE